MSERSTVDRWIDAIADDRSWRQTFGSPDSPVVIAALSPDTLRLCELIRSMCARDRRSLFAIGPSGAGKSLFLSALIAEAEERDVQVHTLSPSSNPERVLRDLGQGSVQLLAVDRFDHLTQGVRNAVVENRHRASAGVFATAEQLRAAIESALTDPLDLVVRLPGLDTRPDDVVAIAQLLWPEVCGFDCDLIGNCAPGAVESLCRGPHREGVTSLRETLETLANALITAGELSEGRFRQLVDKQDIAEALLNTMRSRPLARFVSSSSAVIVVEGDTDVAYLSAAADRAAAGWGWDVLSGCELQPAGQGRSGGADAVWLRLVQLRAASLDCVGLVDNDKSGRHSYQDARGRGVPVELLPADFDRLRLDEEERSLEIEDLLSIRILDAFYADHTDLSPEELRWRNGAWRVVPRGTDKDIVAKWIADHMSLEDSERLVYLLCVLRRRLGMRVPRDDLDAWRRDLASRPDTVPEAVRSRTVSDVRRDHRR